MWRVIQKRVGRDAYPTQSTIVKPGVNPDRFAYWLVHNDEHNITVPLFMYLPYDPGSCHKVIFSIHGRERNGSKYRNIFVNEVQDENVFIIAPQFRDGVFSSSLALTLGNMREKFSATHQRPVELWTFTMIDAFFDLVSAEFPSLTSYALFGHSAGAQFATRMIMFCDHPALKVTVAANPGWFTVLDPETAFPYGIKDVFTETEVRHILSKKMIILAGEADIEVDEKVRLSPGAIVQGNNRFERAQYAFEKASDLAKKLQTPFRWELVLVPGLHHSAKGAGPAALPYLLAN